MPKFMDYHDDLKLPPEAIEQIAQGARDGATDEFGVRQIELYHNTDGKVYCLLDGPDEEAIRKHHAALNVPPAAMCTEWTAWPDLDQLDGACRNVSKSGTAAGSWNRNKCPPS